MEEKTQTKEETQGGVQGGAREMEVQGSVRETGDQSVARQLENQGNRAVAFKGRDGAEGLEDRGRAGESEDNGGAGGMGEGTRLGTGSVANRSVSKSSSASSGTDIGPSSSSMNDYSGMDNSNTRQ